MRSRPGYHEVPVLSMVVTAVLTFGVLWVLDFVVDDPLPDQAPVILPEMDPIAWITMLVIVAVLVWLTYVASTIVDGRAG